MKTTIPNQDPPISFPKLSARLFIVASAYFITGWLGLKLPYFGSHITLIWLPTGIAVAALIRWGLGVWPGIAFSAFLVNYAIGSSVPLALGTAVGNTLGPCFAAYWLLRSGFDYQFRRQTDVVSFIAASAAGMLISASGGTACLYVADLSLVNSASFTCRWRWVWRNHDLCR